MNVFFDLDGVLAVYEREAYRAPDFKWKTLGGHYFLHREPDPKAIELFNMLSDTPGINTFILTAILNTGPECLEQIKDKIEWSQKHLRKIDIQKQFIPSVSSKNRTIRAVLFDNANNLKPSDILIDDYNPNLEDWSNAGGTAVKYINGLNHSSSYKGIVIPQTMEPKDIVELFSTINKTALFSLNI